MSSAYELVDDSREFFAPTSSDMIDGLLSQYQSMRARIEQIAAMIDGEMSAAVEYFLDGNRDRDRWIPSVSKLFRKEGAIAALNSAYWSKTMGLTDVYDAMPQKRRDEWNKAITEKTTPDFTEEAVRPTITEMLASRHKFFAERVDGIFQSLSRTHVTNCPEGFGKRMILSDVYSTYANFSQSGNINDLRCVIAKFMGRDELGYNASNRVIEIARRRHGEWISVDGGAMRIRVYLKGTAHLEIHPDMAYRLNQVLAHLHPFAIPAEFRTKQKKAPREFVMMGRPLPFSVIEILASMKQAVRIFKHAGDWRQPYRHENIDNALKYDHCGKPEKHVIAEAVTVLESIGGAWSDEGWWQFDYDPRDVIADIVSSGCIPDQKAHQFYPTPESVGLVAVEMAEIGNQDQCLEPQAGHGNLAALMPKDRTTCVEISELHCSILKARGFNTVHCDFLKWAVTAQKFDRIVMNPPFSEGRAMVHVETAAGLVKPGGRLVAILPASLKGKDILPGWAVEWSRIFDNEFAGTSVSVVIFCGVKP